MGQVKHGGAKPWRGAEPREVRQVTKRRERRKRRLTETEGEEAENRGRRRRRGQMGCCGDAELGGATVRQTDRQTDGQTEVCVVTALWSMHRLEARARLTVKGTRG